MIWPWSGGKRPAMPSFQQMYGKKGSIVSAVDVILGLGKLGQMDCVKPEGATGFIDTNYENKARAALDFLKDHDFVYLHVEAIDECGHMGDLDLKVKAIQDSDQRLIGHFLDLYKKEFQDDLRVMVLPDHPVPVELRKHTRDNVPFMISGQAVNAQASIKSYNEKSCLQGRYPNLKNQELMQLFFSEKVI
jgi:2,3-bisphosphoglycerate-independent phosphoglycerate mutase